MRTPVVLSVVLSSHLAPVVTFLWFFEELARTFEASQSGGLKFLPWIVIAVLLGVFAIQRVFTRYILHRR